MVTIEESDTIAMYKADFLKSFSNFCENSPLMINLCLINDSVKLRFKYYNEDKKRYEDKELNYTIDFFKTKKDNIFILKKLMIPFYPIIEAYEELKLSKEEIEEKVRNGAKAYEALKETKKVSSDLLKLMRLTNETNTIECVLLRDFEDGKEGDILRFEFLNGSISVFLSKLLDNKEAGSLYFWKTSKNKIKSNKK